MEPFEQILLTEHLKNQIVDIEDYESDMLYIDPTIVYDNISKGNDGWQNKVPPQLIDIILNNKLFLQEGV